MFLVILALFRSYGTLELTVCEFISRHIFVKVLRNNFWPGKLHNLASYSPFVM
jgi:hypothetical protein